MSKIGKQPINLPEEVKVEQTSGKVIVSGPKGQLYFKLARNIDTEINGSILKVLCKKETKTAMSNFGTTRAVLANMVKGVSEGWSKQLELVGTGYRAEVSGKELILTVGFSHPVKIEAPEGISFKVEKNIVTVDGIDKEKVGQTSAVIRAVRPPEPYKGKGIKYIDEIVRRKAGKAAKTVGAA